MGLFSSKKKTYVNTTVQKVFEEAQIKDSAVTGLMRGIVQGDDIISNMLEEITQSVAIRADNGFSWAKKNYFPGLPVSDTKSVVTARTRVLSTLASLIHKTIQADYYQFGPLNSVHYGWQLLVDQYGYNPQTNEIVGLKTADGRPVYLSNIVATYQRKTFDDAVTYNDTGMFEQYGPAPSSGYRPSAPFNTLTGFGQYAPQAIYNVSDTVDHDYITISYEYADAAAVAQTRSLNISMENLDLVSDYHMVRYSDEDGKIRFFTYKDGAGTYPEIDGVMSDDYNDLGTYYPWLYYRFNSTRITDDAPLLVDWYNDSVKWAGKLGVDYDFVAESVEADPDHDDVEQCIMMFGVNPEAKAQSELEYLFEYFSLLYSNSVAADDLDDNLLNKFDDYTVSPSSAQVVQDKYFKMLFNHSGITKKRVAGKLGTVGTFTGEQTSFNVAVNYKNDRNVVVNSYTTMPGYRYRKQVSDAVYEEIEVYNPLVGYQVTDKKGTVGKAGDDTLLIPVDRAIATRMSVRNREDLLQRSLYMVVNTKVVVKSPWYSSGAFKIIMIIVSIIIIALSWGSATPAVAAAWAAGATAFALLVIQTIVISLAVSYAAKLFVKKVGPEIGLLVAVIAIAYGGYSSYGATTNSTSAIWGTRMLMLGNNLAQASNNRYGELIQDTQDDYIDFLNEADAMDTALNTFRDEHGLLAKSKALDGYSFVGLEPMVVLGEAPTDFYTRTVHSGNIGAVSLDVITGYVDQMLTLPKINETKGDFYDGVSLA